MTMETALLFHNTSESVQLGQSHCGLLDLILLSVFGVYQPCNWHHILTGMRHSCGIWGILSSLSTKSSDTLSSNPYKLIDGMGSSRIVSFHPLSKGAIAEKETLLAASLYALVLAPLMLPLPLQSISA
jgi:hypothetical protein